LASAKSSAPAKKKGKAAKTIPKGKVTVRDAGEMVRENKMNYSFNTNLFRAFPNIYDGQKIVARRIIHAANNMKLHHNRPYTKSAAVIGETMRYFHPHGMYVTNLFSNQNWV
jgi:DNA gyrase/topoisomerase IV subunit A